MGTVPSLKLHSEFIPEKMDGCLGDELTSLLGFCLFAGALALSVFGEGHFCEICCEDSPNKTLPNV